MMGISEEVRRRYYGSGSKVTRIDNEQLTMDSEPKPSAGEAEATPELETPEDLARPVETPEERVGKRGRRK